MFYLDLVSGSTGITMQGSQLLDQCFFHCKMYSVNFLECVCYVKLGASMCPYIQYFINI